MYKYKNTNINLVEKNYLSTVGPFEQDDNYTSNRTKTSEAGKVPPGSVYSE